MPCGIVGSAMMAEASATADAPKQQQTWHPHARHKCIFNQHCSVAEVLLRVDGDRKQAHGWQGRSKYWSAHCGEKAPAEDCHPVFKWDSKVPT